MYAELMDLQLVDELGVAQDKSGVGYYVGLVVRSSLLILDMPLTLICRNLSSS
jgi:hypothetical protein